MERRRHVGQVFGRAPGTESPDDELALPRRQSLQGDLESRELFPLCRIASRLGRGGVDEQLVERRLE